MHAIAHFVGAHRKGALLCAIAASLSVAGPTSSRSTEFYDGKVLTFMVGTTAGGGYDQYARTLARHYPRHMPGNPTIVVKNMPAAGSLMSVLYLDATAPKDGTVITSFNAGLIADSLSEGDKAKVKFTNYSWIGSLARDFRVCFAWNATNIRTWDDMVKRNQITFGATGLNSNSYNAAALLRNLFKVNVHIIHGYPGNSEVHLAVERGELDGECVSWTSLSDEWIRNDKINVLVRLARTTAPGIPDSVPFLGDLAQTQEQKDLIDVLLAPGELGRPYIVSKEVPADRLQVLRAAFDAATQDKELLADAEKQRIPLSAISGIDAEKIIGRIYSASPEMIAKANEAIK
jgi:tripartite-type tricarboxylate transporter receptor subunit TctC